MVVPWTLRVPLTREKKINVPNLAKDITCSRLAPRAGLLYSTVHTAAALIQLSGGGQGVSIAQLGVCLLDSYTPPQDAAVETGNVVRQVGEIARPIFAGFIMDCPTAEKRHARPRCGITTWIPGECTLERFPHSPCKESSATVIDGA
jgi:hypothetical protein